MGSISLHITPLVINSLGGGHTHTHTDVRTGTISRNQARAWFKKRVEINHCNKKLGNKVEVLNLSALGQEK